MLKSVNPLIGITTDFKEKNNSIEVGYSSAVADNGGIPVLIPTIPEISEHLEKVILRLDGVIIPGSRDMDPSFYDQEPHPSIRPMSRERTETEYHVVEKALESKIPVLGICGGMQLLNVFFGGSLYQDILSLIDDPLDHEKGAEHEIELIENSSLHRIIGKTRFNVNSYHHQAVDRMGTGLNINARSGDGIVEGFELNGSYLMGVQWHPELDKEDHNTRIFESFLNACSGTV